MDNNNLEISYHKPFIGIFLRKASINKLFKGKNIPTISPFEIANCEAQLPLYYFAIDDIDLKKRIINGTFFNSQNKKWEKQFFAYPDILYKRYQPYPPKRSLYDVFQKQLAKINTQALNYQEGFNKWEVLQHLQQYPELLPHLPATILYNNPQDLAIMLAQHERVYLKACRGGRGRQVIAVTKLPEGSYQYSFFRNALSQFEVDSLDTLLSKVLDFYQERPFIIQAAIDLLQVNNCLIDLRPELQRNGHNEVVLAALPVRVGNSGSPITTHAKSYNFADFFREFMGYSEEKVLSLQDRIRDFVTITYKCIEDAYGPCGEMGIDIGLDKNEQLWFIECNSRSKKVSFFNASDEETIATSYKNLLEYAQYLYLQRDSL